MNSPTYKGNRPFLYSYEHRYEQMLTYPRRSEIKEAYIRYNIYPRINLNKKMDGGKRLRDRKKIAYSMKLFEDPLPEAVDKTSSRRTSDIDQVNLVKNTPLSINRREGDDATDSIVMADLLKNNKHITCRKPKRKKLGRPFGSKTRANRELRTTNIQPVAAVQVEEEVFNDIIFVKGESPDPEDFNRNDIYTLMSNPSDKIKITNKDIRRIVGKHCTLSGKIPSKAEPCLLCDMKLYNYITHKRIQSKKYFMSGMMLDFDEIEISASLLMSKLNMDIEYIDRDFFLAKK